MVHYSCAQHRQCTQERWAQRCKAGRRHAPRLEVQHSTGHQQGQVAVPIVQMADQKQQSFALYTARWASDALSGSTPHTMLNSTTGSCSGSPSVSGLSPASYRARLLPS
eukprot:EG_transcript_50533